MDINQLFKDLESDNEDVCNEALEKLCELLKTDVDPFFVVRRVFSSGFAKARATLARELGKNPALASQCAAPHLLAGMIADSFSSVRIQAIESLANVDPDLCHPPGRGALFLAALFDRDGRARTAARRVIVMALLRDLASTDVSRQIMARRLLSCLDDISQPWLADMLSALARSPETDPWLKSAAHQALQLLKPRILFNA